MKKNTATTIVCSECGKKIKSYTFELVDDKGNVVYTDEVPEAKDAEGNPVIDYEFDYVTDKNIEMIKAFDEYRNTLNKKPIKYSFKPCYIRSDQKDDLNKNTKCMLLFNLSADFMHNRSRYPTDKKLY